MEKERFYTLLNNYTCLTQEEAQVLISLEKEFPFSQVIRSLAARATQDNDLADKDEQLHLGAIYTTDRSVFKSIMTAARQDRKTEPVNLHTEISAASESISLHVDAKELQPNNDQIKDVTTSTLPVENATPSEVTIPSLKDQNTSPGDALYSEIEHDLERLKALKLVFEETFRQFEDGSLSAKADASEKKKNKPADPTEDLLTEIKSSKKKVKVEGPKQKEQIEIIDQFIKTQPTIKGKVSQEEKAAPKDDLSEKNLTYNENIISETLAEILIKQGKKEKAIEVLKKLIWKFPQKKAYFAAQIEDLKK